MTPTDPRAIPREVAARFSELPTVRAVVMSGSAANRVDDGHSDFDIYVYTTEEISAAWRAELARQHGIHLAIDNRYWELGDDWIDTRINRMVDVIYRWPDWIEEQIDRLLLRYEASTGYSTCFWHNVLHSEMLFDRDGWFGRLQERARQPYPEALRRAIVAKNHPILRRTLSSYMQQLELAVERRDHHSVNHRVSALLASYFDILFALNRQPHPGEKRLVVYTEALCPRRPSALAQQVEAVIGAVAPPQQAALLARANVLLDSLDEILQAEGLIDA
jgi:predicted nucleotidyltransferase